jgi:hypothetical protein
MSVLRTRFVETFGEFVETDLKSSVGDRREGDVMVMQVADGGSRASALPEGLSDDRCQSQ